jgi:hypothetical protein
MQEKPSSITPLLVAAADRKRAVCGGEGISRRGGRVAGPPVHRVSRRAPGSDPSAAVRRRAPKER